MCDHDGIASSTTTMLLLACRVWSARWIVIAVIMILASGKADDTPLKSKEANNYAMSEKREGTGGSLNDYAYIKKAGSRTRRPHRALATADDWTIVDGTIPGEATGDNFGNSVSMSGDGWTVAIGAPFNGINDNGSVRVYRYDGASWSQLGLDIDGVSNGDNFGFSVALAKGNPNIVAVGALSAQRDAGQTRVFMYNGSTWQPLGQALDGVARNDKSGVVTINGDGSILAIGAPFNADSATDAGHVRVYDLNFSTSTWILRGTIPGLGANAKEGWSVSLSDDGATLAIGAFGGAYTRVMQYTAGSWTQIQSISFSGYSVALSGDASTLAIGDPLNDSAATDAGRARVYTKNGSTYDSFGSPISGASSNTQLGVSVKLSTDGTELIVGAPGSGGTGEATIYQNTGSAYTILGTARTGLSANDRSGQSVCISDDGATVIVGETQLGTGSGQVRIFSFNTATSYPSQSPLAVPTRLSTSAPSESLSSQPTGAPTSVPTTIPSAAPTTSVTKQPTRIPTNLPTANTPSLTPAPTISPTTLLTRAPTTSPTTLAPASLPTRAPPSASSQPTSRPSKTPTSLPTAKTPSLTIAPSSVPTRPPTQVPTGNPATQAPGNISTSAPATTTPTQSPVDPATTAPNRVPTRAPTPSPTRSLATLPTSLPPSHTPTQGPASPSTATTKPTSVPTGGPTTEVSNLPITSTLSFTPTKGPVALTTTTSPAIVSTLEPTSAPSIASTTLSPVTAAPTTLPNAIPTSTSSPIPAGLSSSPTLLIASLILSGLPSQAPYPKLIINVIACLRNVFRRKACPCTSPQWKSCMRQADKRACRRLYKLKYKHVAGRQSFWDKVRVAKKRECRRRNS